MNIFGDFSKSLSLGPRSRAELGSRNVSSSSLDSHVEFRTTTEVAEKPETSFVT